MEFNNLKEEKKNGDTGFIANVLRYETVN